MDQEQVDATGELRPSGVTSLIHTTRRYDVDIHMLSGTRSRLRCLIFWGSDGKTCGTADWQRHFGLEKKMTIDGEVVLNLAKTRDPVIPPEERRIRHWYRTAAALPDDGTERR